MAYGSICLLWFKIHGFFVAVGDEGKVLWCLQGSSRGRALEMLMTNVHPLGRRFSCCCSCWGLTALAAGIAV